jgi:hypothetical protein
VQVGGAELDRARAEQEGGCDAAAVADAAGGDHRHVDRIRHLWQQGEQAHRLGRVCGEEPSAVAARLPSLGDDGVDASLGEPARLGHRRRIADDDRSGRSHPGEQPIVGKAEMEADDLWAERLHRLGHRRVERPPQGAARARFDCKLRMIRREQGAPGAVVRVLGHVVAEEVEVERTSRAGPDLGDLPRRLVRAQHPAGQRAERVTVYRRGSEGDSARSGHRRLNDRVGRSDQVEEAPIGPVRYHVPVFGIEAQGSAGGSASPAWSNSIEMLSGVRTKAMWPSRGGRLMVTPASISRRQVSYMSSTR